MHIDSRAVGVVDVNPFFREKVSDSFRQRRAAVQETFCRRQSSYLHRVTSPSLLSQIRSDHMQPRCAHFRDDWHHKDVVGLRCRYGFPYRVRRCQNGRSLRFKGRDDNAGVGLSCACESSIIATGIGTDRHDD
jgi:hypothetical protein